MHDYILGDAPSALTDTAVCRRRHTLLAGAFLGLLTAPALAQSGPEAQVSELDAIRVTAPLNQAFEVNVGAFGAKDSFQ